MNEEIKLNQSRRQFLKAAGAGGILLVGGGVIKPSDAFIDPVTGGIIAAAIGSAIIALSNYFTADKRAEVDRRLAAASYQHVWTERIVGNTPVTMDIAKNAYRNLALTLGLTDEADKFGTQFGVKDGLVFVERGKYNGILNAKETMLSSVVYSREGVLMTPMEPMNNGPLSKGDSSRIRGKFENANMDTSDIALLASRRYSLAKTPKQNEAHVELYAYVDKKLSEVGGKKVINYAYLA